MMMMRGHYLCKVVIMSIKYMKVNLILKTKCHVCQPV